MQHVTVGRQFQAGKIVAAQCIKQASLDEIAIKDECFLFLILTQGTLKFTVEGTGYTATAPCFCCFNETADPVVVDKRRAVCDAVYFHPSFLNVNMTFEFLRDESYRDIAENHDLFLLKPFIDEVHILPISENYLEKIQDTYDGMARELEQQRDWYWSCRARSYFMELIIILERMYGLLGYGENTENPSVAAAIEDAHLRKAVMYIEAHYAEDLSLADIVQASGINRTTLTQRFKAETHLTPLQYLMDYRIKVAKKQLRFTEIPVKDIAVRCGLKTVQHFSRIFKMQNGVSPAQYRKQTVHSRKSTMDFHRLMDAAREKLREDTTPEDRDSIPCVLAMLSSRGQIYVTATITEQAIMELLIPTCDYRIEKVICMRKSGYLDLPPANVWRRLDTAQIMLEGKDGYYVQSFEQLLQFPKRRPILKDNELSATYEELRATCEARFDPDFLSAGIRTYREGSFEDELIAEIAYFLEDYRAFMAQNKRYMDFKILLILLSPREYPSYYHLLYAMVSCAEYADDIEALTLYETLEVVSSPGNALLIKGAIAQLKARGADEQARELENHLEQQELIRGMCMKEQRCSQALDVVCDELTRRHMWMENEKDPGSHLDIAAIGYELNIGDVRGEIDAKHRKTLFSEQECVDPDECFDIVLRDYDKLLSAAKSGQPIRFWRNLREPHNACAFAFVCDALRDIDCTLSVVDLPQGYTSWAFVCRYSPFSANAETVVENAEKQRFAAMWQRVREENAPLRAWNGTALCSLPVDYYDEQIFAHIPENGAMIVADLLGRIAGDSNKGDSDRPIIFSTWHMWRIKQFVSDHTLEVVKPHDDFQKTVIRRCSQNEVTIEDLYVIARSELPCLTDKAERLPAPLLYVLLSAKGQLYFVKNDATDDMKRLLIEASDTVIVKWVTLWGRWKGAPESLDLPSYTARKILMELNAANADTALLLQGDDTLYVKRLKDTLSELDRARYGFV